MKITLRTAHKLGEKITGRLSTINVTTRFDVNIHDQRVVADILRGYRVEYNKVLERKLALMSARQEIRMAVQAQNSAEVNGLVSIRKGLLDQIALYRAIHSMAANSGEYNTPEMLEAALVAERASPSRYSTTVACSVLSDAEVIELDRKISEIQLRIEAVEDQLTASNSAGLIMLSEPTLRTLRSEGLVQ